MKQTLILIFSLLGISFVSFGQDSKQADSLMVKSKSSISKDSNAEKSAPDKLIKGESRSSGIVKPEPAIIYRDEEKMLVKPN